MNLIMTIGVPGSGKSTVVDKIKNKYNAKVVCPDDIRFELTGDVADQSKNNQVWSLAFQRLEDHLKNGDNVIFDATFVSRKSRKPALKIGKKYDAKISALFFDVSAETAKQRQKQRDRQVPDHVIDRMYSNLDEPTTVEGFDEIVKYN